MAQQRQAGTAGLANVLSAKVARRGCENYVGIIADDWQHRGIPELYAEQFRSWALEQIGKLSDAEVRALDEIGFLTASGFGHALKKILDAR